jgi:hypothetical protein
MKGGGSSGSIKYIPDKRFEWFKVVYDLIKHRPFVETSETSDSKIL